MKSAPWKDKESLLKEHLTYLCMQVQWVIFKDLPFKTVSYLQFQTSASSCVLPVSTSAGRSPERPPPHTHTLPKSLRHDTRAPTINRADLIPLFHLNELLVMNHDFI